MKTKLPLTLLLGLVLGLDCGGETEQRRSSVQKRAPVPAQTPSPAPTPNITIVSRVARKGNEERMAQAGWKRYVFGSEGGSAPLSVMFPAMPEEFGAVASESADAEMLVHVYVSTAESGIYIAAYADELPTDAKQMSRAAREKFYDNFWRGVAAHMQQEMKREGADFDVRPLGRRPVKLGGLDGQEQIFSIGPMSGQVRMLLFQRRAYLTSIVWFKDRLNERQRVEFERLHAAFFDLTEIGGNY